MFCTITYIVASKITPPLIPSQSTAVLIGKYETAQPGRGVIFRGESPVDQTAKLGACWCGGISLNEDMKKSSRFYSTLTHHLHSQSM